MEDKIIFAMSNASTDVYNNTLSNFKNILPEKIPLREEDNWHIAIESIGMPTEFENFTFPPNVNTPSIILKAEGGSKINVHFPITLYDETVLKNVFENINLTYAKYVNFSITKEKKVLIREGKKRDPLVDITIYIHETMIKNFGFEIPPYYTVRASSKSAKFKEEIYYKLSFNVTRTIDNLKTFDLLNDEPIRHTPLNFTSSYPKVIKIFCDNIEGGVFNNTFSHVIGVFTLEKSVPFYIHQFKTKEYFPILNTLLTKLSITLKDENDKPLNILPGQSTFVKLHLRKMLQASQVVRVTSETSKEFPLNAQNNFSVLLPSTLYLHGQWKVALSSISLRPNFFSVPKVLKMTVNVLQNKLDLSTGSASENVDQTIEIPPGNYTIMEIVNLINNEYAKTNSFNINLSPTGKYDFLCGPMIGEYIRIDHELLQLLGYDYSKINTNGKQTEFTDLYFRKKIRCTAPPRINALKPLYIIVYADFVESSVIGSNYSKVLKVLPITESNDMQLLEFEHLEFFNVQNTQLSFIKIQLRTNAGDLIYFNNTDDVLLSLNFKKS